MHILRRHWLDYDPVALAVLVIGIGMIELLAWGIWRMLLAERYVPPEPARTSGCLVDQ